MPIRAFYAILFIVVLSFTSCRQDVSNQEKLGFKVSVRLSSDPQRLHPMVYNKAISREVYQYIFLPLADYDPNTGELVPILVDKLETPETIVKDEKEYHKYTFDIKPNAVWEDGEQVDGYDYAFTLKAALNPYVNASSWRSYIANIDSVAVDTSNPKSVSIWVLKDYMLGLESAATAQVYPEHVYDANTSLRPFSLNQLDNPAYVEEVVKKDSSLISFAEDFNSLKYSREVVVGCGAYKLKDWVTDQYISIEKIKDYWGDLEEGTYFQNNPAEINFAIIPDETAAITALKDGSIDVLSCRQAANFTQLKESEEYRDSFDFLSPATLKSYYIYINNEDPLLSDIKTRQALAHLIDVEDIIDALEQGLAQPLTTYIHPARSYYNDELSPKKLDLEKAKILLEESGWSDQDSDGVLEKVINGKKEKFEVTFLTTTSKLTQKIGLLLKDQAAKAGVSIELEAKSFGRINKENMATGKYQLVVGATNLDLAPDDLYDRWHSDKATIGTKNSALYKNEEVDDLIERLRLLDSASDRAPLYKRFQEILYEEQPYLFLYSPKLRIIVNAKYNASGSVKRPGYFVNTFQLDK